MNPLNLLDIITYDELDAEADDFFYYLGNTGCNSEWLNFVKEKWR